MDHPSIVIIEADSDGVIVIFDDDAPGRYCGGCATASGHGEQRGYQKSVGVHWRSPLKLKIDPLFLIAHAS